MAEFPALPFFTDAYLADTRHLTTEEHGAYLLLLMCAWRTRGCALKDEDRLLSRMAGLSPGRWRRVRPNLEEFFSVSGGYWRQKKLSKVYETVSKKVEKNRINGAKGGRARAKQVACDVNGKSLFQKEIAEADAHFLPGWQAATGEGAPSSEYKATRQATKAKTTTKLAASQSHNAAIKGDQETGLVTSALCQQVAAAAALSGAKVDRNVVEYWLTCNASVEADVLPTIKRVREREVARTGQAPLHLAYYSAAILEERNKRLGAVSSGQKYAADHPAKAKQIKFDSGNLDHWRQFLGDATSRFRGSYLSSHWRIPAEHPVFLAASLGPDPCHRSNTTIPDEIYAEYGAAWGWRPKS